MTAEQQITKYRSGRIVNASNLAVEYGAFDVKMRGDPCGEIRKTWKMFLFSRD